MYTLEDLNRMIQQDPNNAEAYVLRGFFHGMNNNDKQSIKDLSKALEIEPNPDAWKHHDGIDNLYFNRGLSYDALEDDDNAIKDFDMAIKYNKNNAKAYTFRGIAYGNKKDFNKCISDLETALRIDSSLDLARERLQMARRVRGY